MNLGEKLLFDSALIATVWLAVIDMVEGVVDRFVQVVSWFVILCAVSKDTSYNTERLYVHLWLT